LSNGQHSFRARVLSPNDTLDDRQINLVFVNASVEKCQIAVERSSDDGTINVKVPYTGTDYFDYTTVNTIAPVSKQYRNRIPNQLNCPDYDALMFPLFFRQDTISASHPFAYTRVRNIIKNCFETNDKSDPDKQRNIEQLIALNQELAKADDFNGHSEVPEQNLIKIGKAPWFAYFVPKSLYPTFRYQNPPNKDGKRRKSCSSIVQIVVEVDTEDLPTENESEQ
jgi:hypothetical protein